MSYKEAHGKPSKDLINYNTVFGPDLREVEAQIGGNTKPETLLSKFEPEAETFSDSHVSNVVDFLHALDFIERPEDRVIEQINRNVITDDESVNASFEVRLLYHLRQQTHPQDHLTRVHDVAINKEERTVSSEQLEANLNRELDSYGFEWNNQKVTTWYRLFSNLGVIARTLEEGVILSPSRGLLYKLLSLHSKIENSDDLNDALVWVEDNFMKVYQSRSGTPTVHVAVAQVLENMEEEGAVEFRGMADASNEVKLPAGRSAGVDSRVLKSYSFEQTPSDRAAYALPMGQMDDKGITSDTA
jgi:hypothetical protein